MILFLKKIFVVLLLALPVFPRLAVFADTEDSTYDLVIKGGSIFNPSTEHELENYNIGIKDSKIERITKTNLTGETEINAKGLVVSPGFVDLVSYDPNHVGIDFKVLDGVTSNIAMHGGTEDATSWYRAWGNNGVTTNFGASSFITRLRWPIVGYDVDAEMTEQEDIDELVAATRKNIEEGALGVSFSFEYVPGIEHEIQPLLELAAEYEVPTFYHLRYSDEENGLKGIQEVIDHGKETGATIHIMHINSTGGTFVMDEALELVDEARADGLDISSDFYPYDFWATYIDSARFRPGWQERFKITYEDLQIGSTDIRITEETFDKYRQEHLLVAAHGSMPEEELIMLLKDPHTMIGSDTIIEPSHNNHPRGAGAYSRVFGKYVREEEVLSTMEAIKKVSYFPAKRMEDAAPAMKYKGRIEVGADADITIFNPETIIDKATVDAPGTASVGVEYVLVNGVLVKDEEGLTDVDKPGEPILSHFVDDTIHNEPTDFTITLDDNEPIVLDNAYLINEKEYLPIKELFEQLEFNVKDSGDGKIIVGDNLELEIGNNLASIDEEKIELTSEPIIYNETVYASLPSLEKLLSKNYELDFDKNQLILTSTKEKKAESSIEEATKKEEGSQSKNLITYLIIGTVALVIIGSLIIFLQKQKTINKN